LIFPNKYKCLVRNDFKKKSFQIVPIRYKDRFDIMKWRNQQIYHLRQSKPLTKEVQNTYFKKTVQSLFSNTNPNQILFSYLKNDICIGYGGIVHINWIDKNAEVSFLMNPEEDKVNFELNWSIFLELIEQVAFQELNLFKLYTYAFNVRPNLYSVLERSNYYKEAILKKHCLFGEKLIDVYIHSKMNQNFLFYRKTEVKDIKVYFNWINDPEVRSLSFNSKKINYNDHVNWFNSKINDKDCVMLIFYDYNSECVGQIRFQKDNKKEALISFSVDKNHRNKKYGSKILCLGPKYFLQLNPTFIIKGYVKVENIRSQKVFENAGFIKEDIVEFENHKSFLYVNKKNEN
jgi:RimJ/RimL family protein N-acetyltransferase